MREIRPIWQILWRFALLFTPIACMIGVISATANLTLLEASVFGALSGFVGAQAIIKLFEEWIFYEDGE